MSGGVPFVKMNGLGNEILVVDAREAPLRLDEGAVRRLHEGMAFDQLMLVTAARAPVDARMTIFNGDGSRVAACGNGTRCVAALLFRETERDMLVLESEAGPLVCLRAGEDVTVDMGAPRLRWDEIPLAEPFGDTRTIELAVGPQDAPLLHSPSAVSMGNPHAVFFVADVEAYDLASLGPMLEHHPLFPERANISLAQVTSAEAIRLKVWERGAGLTLACGTAACAAAVAAHRRGLTGREVSVALPGGTLAIEWRERDGHVLMTGPVETEFSGRLDAATLAVEPA